MTRPLWIASRNAKKRAELERLLGPLGFAIHTMDELDRALDPSGQAPRLELPEDEPDFVGNARSKAFHLMQALRRAGLAEPAALALGDDSGLCVDALAGGPGVRSARWAGPTDADRLRALLEALAEAGALGPRTRSAQFVCALCVVGAGGGSVAAVEESCHGTLLDVARGEGGFGYDPLFVPDEHPPGEPAGQRRTFAELTPAEKDAVSHRGRALRALTEALGRLS